jgi:hypothetical protein
VLRHFWAKAGSSSWIGETLIAIDSGTSNSSCHSANCRQASASTQPPIVVIAPVSSAIGMNTAGETPAQRMMIPAEQRLEAGHPLVQQVDDRLVVHLQLAAIERGQHVLAQGQVVHRLLGRAPVEHLDPAPTAVLRGVHRGVGVAQQIDRQDRVDVPLADHPADAHSDLHPFLRAAGTARSSASSPR